MISLGHLFFTMLLVITASAVDSHAQMTVKNSANQTLMQIEQNGAVAVGTTADLGSIPKLHIINGDVALDSDKNLSAIELAPAGPNSGVLTLLNAKGNTLLSNTYTDKSGSGGNIQLAISNGASSPEVALNIDKIGQVGIGTTLPTRKLDVRGQVRIVDGTEAAGKVLMSAADGSASWQTPPSGGVGGSGTATRVAFWSGTAGAASTTLSSNANLYWDNTNSRLGIGTSAPSARLHNNGTLRLQGLGTNTANTAVLTTDANGNVTTRTLSDWIDNDTVTRIGVSTSSADPVAGDVFLAPGSGINLAFSGQTITISSTASGVSGSGTATRVAFWSGTAGAASTSLSSNANLYWDNTSSRLGVGTSAPSAPLHINRGAQSEVLRLEGITASTSNTRLLTSDNSGNVRYRDASSFSTGQHIDERDLISTYNTIVYEMGVKTHDYLEIYLLTSGQNDGEDGGVDEDDDGGWTESHLAIEKWNGSAWVATPYTTGRSVYAADDDVWAHDKYYLQFNLSDAEIPDNTLIRFKIWCTNPPGGFNYHNSGDLSVRYWSHDGGHLSQAVINTL